MSGGKRAALLPAIAALALGFPAEALADGGAVIGGNYAQSCWDCRARGGYTYSCTCQPLSGRPRRTSIDLSGCLYPYELHNIDGRLTCRAHYGATYTGN